MKRFMITMVGLLALSSVGFAAADGDHHAHVAIDDSRFEFLRSLEGTWTATSDGDASERVFEFRATAGGTAIEEREFVGTPMEMLTLYHMEGRNLVAKHYCMLGNQPRLTASRKIVDDTLSFSCDGKPGNAASHADEHVHGWSMRLDGAGRLFYSAKLMKDGHVTEAPSLVLTRKQEAARR